MAGEFAQAPSFGGASNGANDATWGRPKVKGDSGWQSQNSGQSFQPFQSQGSAPVAAPQFGGAAAQPNTPRSFGANPSPMNQNGTVDFTNGAAAAQVNPRVTQQIQSNQAGQQALSSPQAMQAYMEQRMGGQQYVAPQAAQPQAGGQSQIYGTHQGPQSATGGGANGAVQDRSQAPQSLGQGQTMQQTQQAQQRDAALQQNAMQNRTGAWAQPQAPMGGKFSYGPNPAMQQSPGSFMV